MSYTHLKERKFYEDMYDRHTVELARNDLKHFMQMYDKWFEIMPDEKPDSFRSTFHLNWIYMVMCGNALVDRYYGRDEHIEKLMAEDKAKDEQVTAARLTHEPICEHCGKTGLRITSKDLMHRGDDQNWDKPEEVIFMLRCPHCDKNSVYWEDGSRREHRHTRCPKCQSIMEDNDVRHGTVITTTHTCPSCGHAYKTKLDFSTKQEEVPDPDYEKDRYTFCLLDKKVRDEHIDAKRRLEGMIQLGKEWKEKEENKHIYDAMEAIKKPKIPELVPLLSPALEQAGYTEFSLGKPELGRNVVIDFSCLDSKTDRGDYDSRKTLQKLIRQALEDTNWRLTSDGISCRLGYLTGSTRAYDNEDLKKLVLKSKNLKPKQNVSKIDDEHNVTSIDDGKGGRIVL